MEIVRAFVATLLDLPATRRIVDVQRMVRTVFDAHGWRVSWVPPPNLHVTLKFIGDIDSVLVDALGEALARIASRTPPLALAVGGLAVFPSDDHPAVLYVPVHTGHASLTALAHAVDEGVAELGLPCETRSFRAHVTIGRVRHVPADSPPFAALVPPDPALDAGTATADELILYRSDVQRLGSEYRDLRRHRLSGT